MEKSQYLIMELRCMHELKTVKVERATEKTDEESIEVTELGQRVLTLSEVLLTFETESPMFNIKLAERQGKYRTVILSKNSVEVDGTNKIILMIRDITDKVKLE